MELKNKVLPEELPEEKWLRLLYCKKCDSFKYEKNFKGTNWKRFCKECRKR